MTWQDCIIQAMVSDPAADPESGPFSHRCQEGAPIRRFFLFLLGAWLVAGGAAVPGTAVAADPAVTIAAVSAFAEPSGPPLSLDRAAAFYEAGRFRDLDRPALTAGIGAGSHWLAIALDNPTDRTVSRLLIVGIGWIDTLRLFPAPGGSGVRPAAAAGDLIPGARDLVPGVGYRFQVDLPPGRHLLFLQAQAKDPLTIPLRLVAPERLTAVISIANLAYGALYGFLLALIVYNGALALGLGRASHLAYAGYLSAFILTNIAYTGFGFALLWPQAVQFQQFVILVTMVVYALAGLLFAIHFLRLADAAPGWHGVTVATLILSAGAMTVATVAGSQVWAAGVAFAVVVAMTVLMVLLGLVRLRSGGIEWRFFLAAVLCGMAGALGTCLTVLGAIPFTRLGFHAAEIGIVIEAVLLSLALANQVRFQERARVHAERLADVDGLTGLLNRRAFQRRATARWPGGAVGPDRPLSAVLLLDIDRFKGINDRFGHGVGDTVLVRVARELAASIRDGDLLARWGGEEFVLLAPLPAGEDPDRAARQLADRLVAAIRQMVPIPAEALADMAGGEEEGNGDLSLTISAGAAHSQHYASLEEALNAADTSLYAAKAAGRDRAVLASEVAVGGRRGHATAPAATG